MALCTCLANPASYIAIFSLMFVNLFDTTATLLAVGTNAGIIDENGKMSNYRRAVLADATGALLCAPMGTSTLTSFAESNVGIEMGARTGLAALTAAGMFLFPSSFCPLTPPTIRISLLFTNRHECDLSSIEVSFV